MVLPGNKEYVTGDAIQRPQGGGGGPGGSGASEDGEGEDSFRFRLSREEFLDFFFEDMALPDLIKTQLTAIPQSRRVRAGYRTDGTPSNLAVVRTMRESLARRIAFAGPVLARLREVDDALEKLGGDAADPEDPAVAELLREREALRARLNKVPFIDTFDLRYRNRVTQPMPIAQAVMVCVMDVSGSMDESRKDLAKRFFILLHLFLKRHYDRIEIVFIRHHTSAKVVDEEEFFHSRRKRRHDGVERARDDHRRDPRALSAGPVERLRRAGLRRRQLGERLPALPRAAGQRAAADGAVHGLRRDHHRRAAEPVGAVRSRAGDPRPTSRSAASATAATSIPSCANCSPGRTRKRAPPDVPRTRPSPAGRAGQATDAAAPAGRRGTAVRIGDAAPRVGAAARRLRVDLRPHRALRPRDRPRRASRTASTPIRTRSRSSPPSR